MVFLGALRAGIAVAPLAPSATAASIAGMAADAGAKLLFVDAATSEALAQVSGGTGAGRIALMLDSAASPVLSATGSPPKARPDPVSIRPEWAFNIIYSSGTTGAPKGIVQSHAMRWGQVQRTAPYDYGRDAVTLIATPLYSNTTLVSFFPTLGMGGAAVLMGRFDAAAYLAFWRKHRVTHTMLVPVQYQRIMARPTSTARSVAPPDQAVHQRAVGSQAQAAILKRWPGGFVELYGLTEGGCTCLLDVYEHPHKLHTVGRPAAGNDIRMIDEADCEFAAGEAGEMVGRSATMMCGYHRSRL